MIKLFILNFCIIAFIIALLIILSKYIKDEKCIRLLFLIFPLLTVICHYSSFVYYLFANGTNAINYLKSNPNLVIPIYPCNVGMWSCLIYGIFYNKQNRFNRFLTDFIFYFGIFFALGGLFANVDFIKNPTLKDYEVLKGVLAHGFMLLNILALLAFRKVKVNLPINMINVGIGALMLLVVGIYCNLIISVFGSKDYAYEVNSMFLLHSPFDGVSILTFGPICLIAFVLYFGLFCLLELFVYKKEDRWYKRKFNW